MKAVRSLCLRHFWLAMMLVLVALAMKALVPAGYMIGPTEKTFTVEICHGTTEGLALEVVIPGKGQTPDAGSKHAKGECPFAALSHAALGGADPLLLAVALAFLIALGFAPVRRVQLQRSFYLTPPLRGPPGHA